MESDRVLEASYNYLCQLCQENQTTEVHIDYSRLDTVTMGILKEKIRYYFLYLERKEVLKRDMCIACYNGAAVDYIMSILKANTTDNVDIDYDKLTGCKGCNCELLRGLRQVIQDTVYHRRVDLYAMFMRAR